MNYVSDGVPTGCAGGRLLSHRLHIGTLRRNWLISRRLNFSLNRKANQRRSRLINQVVLTVDGNGASEKLMTTTVRISKRTRDVLRELAQATGVSMQEVLEQAVEVYRRERLLAEANAAYAALRSNPQAWQEWQEELAAWDATLADSLEGL